MTEGSAMLCMPGNAWLAVAISVLSFAREGVEHDAAESWQGEEELSASDLHGECRILVALVEAARRAGPEPELFAAMDEVAKDVEAICTERGFDAAAWREQMRRDFLTGELQPQVVQILNVALAARAARG